MKHFAFKKNQYPFLKVRTTGGLRKKTQTSLFITDWHKTEHTESNNLFMGMKLICKPNDTTPSKRREYTEPEVPKKLLSVHSWSKRTKGMCANTSVPRAEADQCLNSKVKPTLEDA